MDMIYICVLLVASGCTGALSSSDFNWFLGIGYNILQANPDAALDPGILSTRRIGPDFNDIKYLTNGVSFRQYNTCIEQKEVFVYSGQASYQRKLFGSVTETGEKTSVYDYAFTLSDGYKVIGMETNKGDAMYRDDVISCNMGTARAPMGLLSYQFQLEVCQLPVEYDELVYKRFLDDWGTHVIAEVTFGTKTITRSKLDISDMITHALQMGPTAIDSLNGTSLKLNMDNINLAKDTLSRVKTTGQPTILTSGTVDTPQPIRLRILPITTLIGTLVEGRIFHKFKCETEEIVDALKRNIDSCLLNYARITKVSIPPSDFLSYPFGWPKGKYVLVQSASGCPGPTDVWSTGGIRYKTNRRTRLSESNHFRGSAYGTTTIMDFCVKHENTISSADLPWPTGNYCIAKFHNCPSGFTFGYLGIDGLQIVQMNGLLPAHHYHIYDNVSAIEYCCRQDGDLKEAIFLPTTTPFYLFPNTGACQRVLGMTETQEYIRWDNPSRRLGVVKSDTHPKAADISSDNVKIYHCYYEPRCHFP